MGEVNKGLLRSGVDVWQTEEEFHPNPWAEGNVTIRVAGLQVSPEDMQKLYDDLDAYDKARRLTAADLSTIVY